MEFLGVFVRLLAGKVVALGSSLALWEEGKKKKEDRKRKQVYNTFNTKSTVSPNFNLLFSSFPLSYSFS